MSDQFAAFDKSKRAQRAKQELPPSLPSSPPRSLADLALTKDEVPSQPSPSGAVVATEADGSAAVSGVPDRGVPAGPVVSDDAFSLSSPNPAAVADQLRLDSAAGTDHVAGLGVAAETVVARSSQVDDGSAADRSAGVRSSSTSSDTRERVVSSSSVESAASVQYPASDRVAPVVAAGPDRQVVQRSSLPHQMAGSDVPVSLEDAGGVVGAVVPASGVVSSGVAGVAVASAAGLQSAGVRRSKRTFYLPGPVMEELRSRCDVQRITYAEMVLSVFDAWFDRVDEVFPPLPSRRSPLPSRRPPRRSRVPNLTPVHLMLDPGEWELLESTRERLEVASLSELISGVLESEFEMELSYRRAQRS